MKIMEQELLKFANWLSQSTHINDPKGLVKMYLKAESKAENLPISDVVLLSSLDVGDRFAIEDEEDIIGDDYYEVLGKSTTSILCKKPSGRNDRYFPETRVKLI
jgi:hypothetical protein